MGKPIVDETPEDKRPWRWVTGSMLGMGDFAFEVFEDPLKSDDDFVICRKLTKIAVVPGRGVGLIKWIGYSEGFMGAETSDEKGKIEADKTVEGVCNRDTLVFCYDAGEKLTNELDRLWFVKQIEISKGGILKP